MEICKKQNRGDKVNGKKGKNKEQYDWKNHKLLYDFHKLDKIINDEENRG